MDVSYLEQNDHAWSVFADDIAERYGGQIIAASTFIVDGELRQEAEVILPMRIAIEFRVVYCPGLLEVKLPCFGRIFYGQGSLRLVGRPSPAMIECDKV
jgi:hypothetical protein